MFLFILLLLCADETLAVAGAVLQAWIGSQVEWDAVRQLLVMGLDSNHKPAVACTTAK